MTHVISLNIKRRHLTSSQLATIAVDLLPELKKEAKKRQATSTGGVTPQLNKKFYEADKGQAIDHAAKLVGTNRQYVSQAKRLKEEDFKVFEEVKSPKSFLKWFLTVTSEIFIILFCLFLSIYLIVFVLMVFYKSSF